jgi:hypothetical protein
MITRPAIRISKGIYSQNPSLPIFDHAIRSFNLYLFTPEEEEIDSRGVWSTTPNIAPGFEIEIEFEFDHSSAACHKVTLCVCVCIYVCICCMCMQTFCFPSPPPPPLQQQQHTNQQSTSRRIVLAGYVVGTTHELTTRSYIGAIIPLRV